MGESQPERFGRYRLTRRLAQGGMAEIWLARDDNQPDRDVVVKRIHPHLAVDEQFVMMFLDEARIAARLKHHGYVEIFDLGCHDESYYLAMEYIHGEDIRAIVQQARKKSVPLPRKLAIEIIAEAALVLHHAHDLKDGITGKELNIVHRDVSPQNILVTYEGAVKIVDFGIAKAADQANKTQVGVLKGKYAYMSPEQVRSQPLDRRSDVFALGILIYELTTGKRLFKASTELETMRRIMNGDIVHPTVASPGYPVKLESILLKALAPRKEDRHASAKILQEELREFLAEHNSSVDSKEISSFMKHIFSERIKAEEEAKAQGDREAFLLARFGKERRSGNSSSESAENSANQPVKAKRDSPDSRADSNNASNQASLPPPPAQIQGQEFPTPQGENQYKTSPSNKIRQIVDAIESSIEGLPDEAEHTRTVSRSCDPSTLSADISGSRKDQEPGGIYSGLELDPQQPKQEDTGIYPNAEDLAVMDDGLTRIKRTGSFPPIDAPLTQEKKAKRRMFLGASVAATIALLIVFAISRFGAGAEHPDGQVIQDTQEDMPSDKQTDESRISFDKRDERDHRDPQDHERVSKELSEVDKGDNLNNAEDILDDEPPEEDDTDEPHKQSSKQKEVDKAPTKQPPRRPAPRFGFINIRGDDIGEVYLNGEKIGDLPISRHRLPPGSYTFTVKGQHREASLSIQLRAGGTITRTVSISTGLLRVRARPWATIYLDGRQIGTTPMAPRRIPAGSHTVEAHNPDLNVRRQFQVTIEPNGEFLLDIDLTK